MKVLIISIIILFYSCKSSSTKKYYEKRSGDILIKGHVVEDSVFEDTFYYYDQNEILIRKDIYKRGKLNGLSMDLFRNGKPSIVTSYTDGLKNGTNSFYDSNGQCYYRDYYYYDLVTGPIIFYEKNQKPKRFFFANLQNETIFEIDYQNWSGIENHIGKCINYTYNQQQRDSLDENLLLLYLINPPKFSFDFSVIQKRKEANEEHIVIGNFKNETPFVNLILPKLDSNKYYSIKLSVYDSILNKKTIIYKDVW